MVRFDGEQVAAKARGRTREQRRRIQIIFQNPTDSLNPRQTVAAAIERPLRLFRSSRGRHEGARVDVPSLITRVGLPAAAALRYPRELSGGERQRVAIARALAAQPDLLICDEVTSALDVSVQATVLELLDELRRELGLAMLFISHDLGVVSTIADRVMVLQGGIVRETGTVAAILHAPTNGYTRLLVDAAPHIPDVFRTASSESVG